MSSQNDDGPLERPDDHNHYRNLHPEPALYVLQRHIEEYRSLEWIPHPDRYWLHKGDDEVRSRSFNSFDTLH